jgi:hypothetical protein
MGSYFLCQAINNNANSINQDLEHSERIAFSRDASQKSITGDAC